MMLQQLQQHTKFTVVVNHFAKVNICTRKFIGLIIQCNVCGVLIVTYFFNPKKRYKGCPQVLRIRDPRNMPQENVELCPLSSQNRRPGILTIKKRNLSTYTFIGTKLDALLVK